MRMRSILFLAMTELPNKPDKERCIDLWSFSLTHQPPWALDVLNADEKLRAESFYFERHRRRFITARAMLRYILSCYLIKDPQDIVFQYGLHGKPFVIYDITFNLSHSGDMAALGVGYTHEIGVDIERFSTRPYLKLAQSFFAKEEMLWLNRVPEAMSPLIFFKVWTQKEAFIKAIGAGLSYPTQTIQPKRHGLLQAFPFWDVLEFKDELSDRCKKVLKGQMKTEKFEFIEPDTNTIWDLYSSMPMPGFSMTVCCHPDIERIQYLTIDPNTLRMNE